MKFQGLFFLFALTSANFFSDLRDFEQAINKKLNITESQKNFEVSNASYTVRVNLMTTTTTTTTTTISTITTTTKTTTTIATTSTSTLALSKFVVT